LTRLRITLLTTSHLWVLAKGAGKIAEEITVSKISQIRPDASEAKFHENVDFAYVKRSFWMKNGSRALAGEGPFWPWDGFSCRPGGDLWLPRVHVDWREVHAQITGAWALAQILEFARKLKK
jgi:hypothetical protein